MKGIDFEQLDGSQVRVGIVVSRWNNHYTYSLRDGCIEALKASGVVDTHIVVREVPGAFELLYGAKKMIEHNGVDVVIVIGVVIKGETPHDEYICKAVSEGVAHLNISGTVPVIFGVLTSVNEKQAEARSIGEGNHGPGWGKTAVEMALLHTR